MQAITSSIWSNVRNFDNLAISPGSVEILWVFCVYFVKRSYSNWKKLTESKKQGKFFKIDSMKS